MKSVFPVALQAESDSQSKVSPVDTTGATPSKPAHPPTFAAFRHRNFRLYAMGMLVSMAGSWMQIIAQGWLVYQISGSEWTLGLVGFASAIPALIISPWAGVIIDRVPRRGILYATQSAAMSSALILAWLTFTGQVQVWHIVALAVGLGVVNAFDAPTRQAFVVEMVGRDDLPNAIAVNSMIFNGARIVGPAFGGLLLAWLGAGWCFLINGASYLGVLVALFLMQLAPYIKRVRLESPWAQLKNGVTYVQKRGDLRGILSQAAIFGVFGVSYSTVLPAYVDSVLHVGPAAYGAINAASGVGAVTSALFLARYGSDIQRGRWLTGVALAFPFVLMAFAWAPGLPVALGLAFILGVCFLGQFTLLNTLLQTRVDDTMRGRVMSLYTLIFFGIAPFGNLTIGAVSEFWGLSVTLTLSAAITLALSALNLLRSDKVRSLR
jgi:MFS family permease